MAGKRKVTLGQILMPTYIAATVVEDGMEQLLGEHLAPWNPGHTDKEDLATRPDDAAQIERRLLVPRALDSQSHLSQIGRIRDRHGRQNVVNTVLFG